jgi:hypothetical protein
MKMVRLLDIISLYNTKLEKDFEIKKANKHLLNKLIDISKGKYVTINSFIYNISVTIDKDISLSRKQ